MLKWYYLYYFIAFVTSSKGAKIYLTDNTEDGFEIQTLVKTKHKLIEPELYTYLPSDVENRIPQQEAVLNLKSKTTCVRYFGSSLVTKLQKLQCNTKNKQFDNGSKSDVRSPGDNANIIKFADDYLDVRDLARFDYSSKSFSDNYVDVNDLGRASHKVDYPPEYFDYLFNFNLNLPLKIKKNKHFRKECALTRSCLTTRIDPKDN